MTNIASSTPLQTHGIHHISSIVGHAQRDIDFNAGVLALRLVKQTLNYDDRHGYHFYYGNDKASTSLTTTFPLIDSDDGEVGAGQVGSIQYAIRMRQSGFWTEHLKRFGIETRLAERMGYKVLTFRDPSGLYLELVETELGPENSWTFGAVGADQAITGIHAATLLSRQPAKTLALLTKLLGYSLDGQDAEWYRLKIHEGIGGLLYLNREAAPRGTMGIGTVHHIALRVKDDEIERWGDRLREAGYLPTEVKNRNYFRSVYFREKGGILIELATEGPGVFIDEEQEHVGERFIIPQHLLEFADDICEELVPVEVREVRELRGYA